jgi:hypothetical protein
MKPWSAASIRLRLTSWYTFALALMLIVYATATYVAVRHEFLEQLDDQLHDDFETAEGVLTPTSGGRVSWAGDHHHDPDNDADRRIDVWSANGERIYASTTALALPPAALTAITSIPRYESIAVAGQQWRTLTGTTSIGGRAVVLRVTRSEDRVLGQLSEVLTVLVLGLPLVVVLAGVGGYLSRPPSRNFGDSPLMRRMSSARRFRSSEALVKWDSAKPGRQPNTRRPWAACSKRSTA